MSGFLKRGDVIGLEEGMTVQANNVPTWAVPRLHEPYNTATTYAIIKIGKVYCSEPFSKTQMAQMLQQTLQQFGVMNEDAKVWDFIASLPIDTQPKSFPTAPYAGEYVVYKAERLQQRIGAQYHVFCYKKADAAVQVDFFQQAPARIKWKHIIEEIEPVGHLAEEEMAM